MKYGAAAGPLLHTAPAFGPDASAPTPHLPLPFLGSVSTVSTICDMQIFHINLTRACITCNTASWANNK
ncbi:hypothetical protein M5D96_013466 [Drosophila gunungcola]|uniref:Uncharacterized protein n=1 Tax=Drosophila gunungcola TaxID=103775 RepID=A0A9Q0BJC1_9MUSC|nr:hypothetical protein M5D96_013466 [Drosophila gunungcola]